MVELGNFPDILMSYKMVILVIVTMWVSWMLNLYWLRPKKLERWLRQQGLSGNSYRISFEVSKAESKMRNEAESMSLKVSDDLVPKLYPSFNKNVKTYGCICYRNLITHNLLNYVELIGLGFKYFYIIYYFNFY